MILVYLGLALWAWVIINAVARRLAEWLDRRPLTAADDYYSWADARLDELAARDAVRPHGNCMVVPIHRTRDHRPAA